MGLSQRRAFGRKFDILSTKEKMHQRQRFCCW